MLHRLKGGILSDAAAGRNLFLSAHEQPAEQRSEKSRRSPNDYFHDNMYARFLDDLKDIKVILSALDED
jgi:hypothetical protein